MSNETAVQELERVKGELKAKSDECATLTQQLADSKTALTAANASVETFKTEISGLNTKLKDSDTKIAAAEAATKTEKDRADREMVRADKAEKKLAMDPAHIDVSGRKVAVTDGTTAGGEGKNVLEQFSAMPEGNRAERKAKSDFYVKNKAEIIRLKNLPKEK